MRTAKTHPGMENTRVPEMEEILLKEFSKVIKSAISIKEICS